MDKKKNNIFTPSGERVTPMFKKVFDDRLKCERVKEDGTFDIYEFIQASNSQSDLSQLRQELISTGQVPVISDEVVDYSLFPNDIHQLNDVVNSTEKRFNALPESIKAVFGTKDNFLASLVKGTYEQDIVNYYKAAAKNNPKADSSQSNTEVVTNE